MILIDCNLKSKIKRPYNKYLINLCSVITGKSQASVRDFPVMTSLSLYRLYVFVKTESYLGLLQRHKIRKIKAMNRIPPATAPVIMKVFLLVPDRALGGP